MKNYGKEGETVMKLVGRKTKEKLRDTDTFSLFLFSIIADDIFPRLHDSVIVGFNDPYTTHEDTMSSSK